MIFRLNRAIAATGYCSRRRADELIADRQVRVNGEIVTDFNFGVDLELDQLVVHGSELNARKYEYIALYKPRGVITTCDDERGRETVVDLLPDDLKHLKPVGRLDRHSEGLLILTNDGEFSQSLAHPRKHVFKRYEVTVRGSFSLSALQMMQRGMKLEDGMTLPAKVKLLRRGRETSVFQIAIQEGRNRQIRRMCAQLGYPITRLVRVAIGGLQLMDMDPGGWRHLTAQEIDSLKLG